LTTKNDNLVQAHTDIQKVLRGEIVALRDLLNKRLAEIEKLTNQLTAPQQTSEHPEQMAAMAQRHEVEIALLHARYNCQIAQLPERKKQIETLTISKLFDVAWYLHKNPDVAESDMTPREHYLVSGSYEKRNPSETFDTMAYYLANPDVAKSGWPALLHYEMFGRDENRPLH